MVMFRHFLHICLLFYVVRLLIGPPKIDNNQNVLLYLTWPLHVMSLVPFLGGMTIDEKKRYLVPELCWKIFQKYFSNNIQFEFDQPPCKLCQVRLIIGEISTHEGYRIATLFKY